MKLAHITIAVISCLAGAMGASATPAVVTTTYAGSTATDSYMFSLAEESTVSIVYSWSDMRLAKGGGNRFSDGAIKWTLSGDSTQSGTITDDKNVDIVSEGVLNLGNLGAGTYELLLSGTWDSVPLNGNGNSDFVRTAGTVNLIDGDLVGNQAERNSFSAIRVGSSPSLLSAAPVSNVPEPQTFIMTLTGLGLVTMMIRRRKPQQS